MALTVEDGSIVAGAESYLTLAAADAYFAARDNPVTWTGTSDALKESALRYATQVLDNAYNFLGQITDLDQVLKWPRQAVADNEGRVIDSDEIPQVLKDAQAEYALQHLLTGSLNQVLKRGGDIKRVKAGSVEVEYGDNAKTSREYLYIDDIIRPIIESSANGMTITVERA